MTTWQHTFCTTQHSLEKLNENVSIKFVFFMQTYFIIANCCGCCWTWNWHWNTYCPPAWHLANGSRKQFVRRPTRRMNNMSPGTGTRNSVSLHTLPHVFGTHSAPRHTGLPDQHRYGNTWGLQRNPQVRRDGLPDPDDNLAPRRWRTDTAAQRSRGWVRAGGALNFITKHFKVTSTRPQLSQAPAVCVRPTNNKSRPCNFPY